MEKKEPVETGEACPECGSPLVIRKGRYGEFTACSNYPECKYIKKEPREVKEIMDCPLCNGKVIEKPTRRGKIFYGCNNYPKCKFASWEGHRATDSAGQRKRGAARAHEISLHGVTSGTYSQSLLLHRPGHCGYGGLLRRGGVE